MKTQLIPLESHDDLVSVRDRMSWAKTPRILLIWPTTERVSLRPLDLKVLQRHAESLGAQLGLVTRQRDILREARARGIPVFVSAGEAQRTPWPERESPVVREPGAPRGDLREKRAQVRLPEAPWRTHPVTRLLAFLLGVLAVLTIVSLFVPRATIFLAPEAETQSVLLPVQADPSLEGVFITGSLPSRELSLVVEGQRERAASGQLPFPQSQARGKVTFRNLTQDPVVIPAGTVLTSTGLPGARFLTAEEGQLDSGLNVSLEIPVIAEKSGESGNVESGAIQAIEGYLGLFVSVSNDEPTAGGSDRMMAAPTERDAERLRAALQGELETAALEEMAALLEQDDQLFEESLEVAGVLDEVYEPALGRAGESLILSMRIEFTCSYADGEDLRELVETVLNASLPSGYEVVAESLVIEPAGAPRTSTSGLTRWQLRAERRIQRDLDELQVLALVRGRTPENAQAWLEASLPPLADPARIDLVPSWWPWLPLVPMNIRVEVP